MVATKIMDCQLFPFIFTKIKVMKRETWASQMTVILSFVCWPCTMPVSRHSCEDPKKMTQLLFQFQHVEVHEAGVLVLSKTNKTHLLQTDFYPFAKCFIVFTDLAAVLCTLLLAHVLYFKPAHLKECQGTGTCHLRKRLTNKL